MSAATILVVLLLAAIVLWAPRRWALLALFASAMYLSHRNGVNILGLRMYPGRFLEMAAFIRVLFRREFHWREFNSLDSMVALAYSYVTIVFLIRTALGFGTSEAITMVTPLAKVGELVDVLLIYVAFRGLVKDTSDLRWLLRGVVFLLVPYVCSLWIERVSGQNPLAVVGAVPRVWTDANDGRVRCMGAFSHPALLGTFGAALAAMYIAMVVGRVQRAVGVAGLAASLAIVLMANSGGPLTMLVVIILGWVCWLIRAHMKMFRLILLAAAVSLVIVMRDPIWYLPSKMSLVFGGGGWHRSYLMQQAINDFDKWWLGGMPLDLTLSWFPYLILNAADITNVYVAFGIDGGLMAIVLFVLVFIIAFKYVGHAAAAMRSLGTAGHCSELIVWGLGAALAGHMVNFISITYFDQSMTFWLFELAAVSGVAATSLSSSTTHKSIGHRPAKEPAAWPKSNVVPVKSRRARKFTGSRIDSSEI